MLSRKKENGTDASKGKSLSSTKRQERAAARAQQKQLKRQRKSTAEKNAGTKKRLKKAAAPETTSQCLAYEALYDDGLCEIEEGLYSRTFKFSDINYQSARQEEQEGTFDQYCEILNSIEPPLHWQINIVDRSINPEKFRSSMFLRMAGDEEDRYRREMNEMLADKALEGENSILRDKYLTLSAPADSYETAKAILGRFEADFANQFKNLGCDIQPLTGAQRVELLQSITRPEDPFLFSYEEMLYAGLRTKDFVSPTSLDFSDRRYFRLGDKFAEVLILRDLPATVSDQLLTMLTALPLDMVISLHLDKIAQGDALEMVKKKLAWMEGEQSAAQEKAFQKGRDPNMAIPQEIRRRYRAAEDLLDKLSNQNQRLFRSTVLIYTYADTLEQLNENILQISGIAAQKSCTVKPVDFQQQEAFNSILPLGKNHLHLERTLTTAAAAVFIPFTTQELYQMGGMYYGQNAMSHNMIFFSRYNLKAANGVIVGSPGSGKSFCAKREIINVLLNDPNADVIVIDPEREYTALAQGLSGEIIHISAGSAAHLNPMDISENYADDDNPLLLKSEFLLSLIDLIAGGHMGLTQQEQSIASRVCALTYAPYFSHPEKNPVPTLRDYWAVLKDQPEPEAQSLALSLELYIDGALSVFAHRTNVDTGKRFVVYDIRDLGSKLRTLGMLIVLDQVWNRITQNRQIGKRTWLYVDEFQLLLTNEYCSNYFFELWSRARKWGAVPTGITQNVETLLLSDNARRMLSNSDFILMMNQAQPDRVELARLLNMSNKLLSHVSNVEPGHGLLFAGSSIIPFVDSFPQNTELYRMMTTKIEEVS